MQNMLLSWDLLSLVFCIMYHSRARRGCRWRRCREQCTRRKAHLRKRGVERHIPREEPLLSLSISCQVQYINWHASSRALHQQQKPSSFSCVRFHVSLLPFPTLDNAMHDIFSLAVSGAVSTTEVHFSGCLAHLEIQFVHIFVWITMDGKYIKSSFRVV